MIKLGLISSQMEAWVLHMFFNFYPLKYYKIVNNSTTTEAIRKIGPDMESLAFYNLFRCIFKFYFVN